jgi:cystathionine beta-lyase family protein involved in aluminum resistance
MTTSTLVLVDAGMVAGFRRATISLAQLHQALVHLYRQHPEVKVAVVADPSVKWDLTGQEPAAFEGDVIAGAVVCAPAGALEGTAGFLERAASRATAAGYDVVAFTARALPGVALGQLRNEGGRWLWDLAGGRTLDAADAEVAASASPNRRRRRSR